MKPAFISILALLAIAPAKPTDIGKDGFNFYKDYLRAKSDDATAEEVPIEDRMLYFYRTPLPLYSGIIPQLEQEYRKRTGNAFKNHMLSKELWDGEAQPQPQAQPPRTRKRSSKTALSLLMQGKHPYIADGGQPDDVIDIPLKVD